MARYGKRRRVVKKRKKRHGAKAAFCRNLRRLASRARTAKERSDARVAIVAHNRRGDVSNAYAKSLLKLTER